MEDISFLFFGYAAAIATSSMTTEIAKGKTIEEALKLTDDDRDYLNNCICDLEKALDK